MLFTKTFGTESYESVKKKIYFAVEATGDAKLEHFVGIMHKISEQNDNHEFKIEYIKDPIKNLRGAFADYIAANGISSLYNFSFAQDAISAPCGKIEENLDLHKKFISTLSPADSLLIIDPYFFSADTKIKIKQSVDIFNHLLQPLYNSIEHIAVISSGKNFNQKCKDDLEKELNITTGKNIKFNTIHSDEIHDRFWIAPQKNSGVVFGTSLSGIGKRLSLVDKLSAADVSEIMKFLQKNDIYPAGNK